jgi:hypothetical protein
MPAQFGTYAVRLVRLGLMHGRPDPPVAQDGYRGCRNDHGPYAPASFRPCPMAGCQR